MLVLPIEGDDESASLQRDLISTLNNNLNYMDIKKIIVRGCNKTVSESDGYLKAHKKVRKIWEKYNAVLVIWGNRARNDKFHPRITIVEDLASLNAKNIKLPEQNIRRTKREISLPYDLVSQPIYLTKFIAGYNQFRKDNYSLALIHFEALLKLQTINFVKFKDILLYAAGCHLFLSNDQTNKNDHLDQAIADFTKAIEIGPKDADVYNNRGIAYAAKGLYDQAIADYTKAIEIDPEYAEAYYNFGCIYS